MRLITAHEEKILVDTKNKIKELQAHVSAYKGLETFHQLDNRIKANLNKLEASIMETKQSKFLWDMQDYKSETVYMWPRMNNNKGSTPRSILRNKSRFNKRSSRVNFDSTEVESSDSAPENAESVATTSRSNPVSHDRSKQPSKNGAKQGEQDENISTQRRSGRKKGK